MNHQRERRPWIADTPSFALAAPVSMGVVCFRHAPGGLDARALDRHNEGIVERVNASGAAYLTHTRLRGLVCMRIGIGNVRTTEDHLRQVWTCVVAEAARGAE